MVLDSVNDFFIIFFMATVLPSLKQNEMLFTVLGQLQKPAILQKGTAYILYQGVAPHSSDEAEYLSMSIRGCDCESRTRDRTLSFDKGSISYYIQSGSVDTIWNVRVKVSWSSLRMEQQRKCRS